MDLPPWIIDALSLGRHESETDPNTKAMLNMALELEWRRISTDCLYFMRTYMQVLLHNTAEVVTLPITEEQIDLVTALLELKKLICLKARQVGFSTAISGVSFWEVYFHPFWHTLFLSKTEDDAIELLAKSKLVYEQLPQWIKDRGPSRVTDNNGELRFDNNSVIESLPSKSNPARSRSARRVVADEFAFFDDQAGATASFGPTVDSGAFLVLLSTANGIGDEFERLVQGARAGNDNGGWPLSKDVAANVEANTYSFRFYSWRARKDRDDAWYENKRKDMLPWQLAQEYPSDPDEAFKRSGNLYFDADTVAGWLSHPGEKGFLTEDGMFAPDFDGNLEIWEEPVKGAKYALGVDPAGEVDGDGSVLNVIRAKTGQHVATMKLQVEGDKVAAGAYALGKFYNWAFLGVEANGVGKAVLLELKRTRYPRLYTRWIYDKKQKTRTEKLGWYTSVANKEPMLLGMWRVFRDALVRSYDTDYIRQMGEYRRFVDKEGRTTRLGGQPHDDHVMSMAICVQLLQHLGVEYVERIEAEEEPILEPGVVDYGPKKGPNFGAWAKLVKENAWAPTTPRPVRSRTATPASSAASGSMASTPRRPTRTGR